MTQQLSTHLGPALLGHTWQMDLASLGLVGQVGMTAGPTAPESWFLGLEEDVKPKLKIIITIDFTIHIRSIFFQ
jgi:hypothetical protein